MYIDLGQNYFLASKTRICIKNDQRIKVMMNRVDDMEEFLYLGPLLDKGRATKDKQQRLPVSKARQTLHRLQ